MNKIFILISLIIIILTGCEDNYRLEDLSCTVVDKEYIPKETTIKYTTDYGINITNGKYCFGFYPKIIHNDEKYILYLCLKDKNTGKIINNRYTEEVNKETYNKYKINDSY